MWLCRMTLATPLNNEAMRQVLLVWLAAVEPRLWRRRSASAAAQRQRSMRRMLSTRYEAARSGIAAATGTVTASASTLAEYTALATAVTGANIDAFGV